MVNWVHSSLLLPGVFFVPFFLAPTCGTGLRWDFSLQTFVSLPQAMDRERWLPFLWTGCCFCLLRLERASFLCVQLDAVTLFQLPVPHRSEAMPGSVDFWILAPVPGLVFAFFPPELPQPTLSLKPWLYIFSYFSPSCFPLIERPSLTVLPRLALNSRTQAVLLPQPSRYQDFRRVPPCLALFSLISDTWYLCI